MLIRHNILKNSLIGLNNTNKDCDNLTVSKMTYQYHAILL